MKTQTPLEEIRKIFQALQRLTDREQTQLAPNPETDLLAQALAAAFAEQATAQRDWHTATTTPHEKQPDPVQVIEIKGRAGTGGLAYLLKWARTQADTNGNNYPRHTLNAAVEVFRAGERFHGTIALPLYLHPDKPGEYCSTYWDRYPTQMTYNGDKMNQQLPPGALAAIRDHITGLMAGHITPATIAPSLVAAIHRETAAELHTGLAKAEREIENALRKAEKIAKQANNNK